MTDEIGGHLLLLPALPDLRARTTSASSRPSGSACAAPTTGSTARRPTRSTRPAPTSRSQKGECLDPVRGQWKGVNDYVYTNSKQTIERFNAYSIMEHPMTSCGCFEAIVRLLPECNGVMIVNREFLGDTPSGMKFSTLAGSVGGGQQTPGFMACGKAYHDQPQVPLRRRRAQAHRLDAQGAQGDCWPRTSNADRRAAGHPGLPRQDRGRDRRHRSRRRSAPTWRRWGIRRSTMPGHHPAVSEAAEAADASARGNAAGRGRSRQAADAAERRRQARRRRSQQPRRSRRTGSAAPRRCRRPAPMASAHVISVLEQMRSRALPTPPHPAMTPEQQMAALQAVDRGAPAHCRRQHAAHVQRRARAAPHRRACALPPSLRHSAGSSRCRAACPAAAPAPAVAKPITSAAIVMPTTLQRAARERCNMPIRTVTLGGSGTRTSARHHRRRHGPAVPPLGRRHRPTARWSPWRSSTGPEKYPRQSCARSTATCCSDPAEMAKVLRREARRGPRSASAWKAPIPENGDRIARSRRSKW